MSNCIKIIIDIKPNRLIMSLSEQLSFEILKDKIMKDLEYLTTGLFTTFFVNTPAGNIAWNAIANETNGTGKIFTIHLQNTLIQLRKAGYSVGKAKKPTMSIDDILNELAA